jgi:glycosyltransferase involved in cell wall biosynthesis
MPPEVTAVITTHVRPLHVFDALASVRAEMQKNVEIIVVDDGGDFADCDVRIVRGGSVGVARVRNLGLAAARGEFIIFLDDDDVALPHRISTLLSVARQHDAALVFGLTSRVVPGTSISLPPVPTHRPSSGAVGFCDVLACAPHINAVLVRTQALRDVGGFDEAASHFDDWSAWLRIADRYARIWSVNDVVAEWRIHPNGLSGQVLTIRAMKARLVALFERLMPCLSPENARRAAIAREIVLANDVTTYDDYVQAVVEARDRLATTRGLRIGSPRTKLLNGA